MKQIQIVITGLIALLCMGCFGMQSSTKTTVPRYSPSFDYSPPQRASSNSAGITISLINPSYTKTSAEQTVAPYSTFIENMGDDFEEMLIAKGVSLRGPFKSRDEMVYGDKKNSDMALKVSISLKRDGQLRSKQMVQLSSTQKPSYKVYGSFTHHGNLILEIVDPFTGEKFWKKSVELPRKEVVCQGKKYWYSLSLGTLLKDDGVYNPIAKALEEYYQNALSTAWRHIDVEEFKQIKKEIAKAQKDRK